MFCTTACPKTTRIQHGSLTWTYLINKVSLETSIKLNSKVINKWTIIVAMKTSVDCPLVSRELTSWPPWLVFLKWKLICQLSRPLQCRFPIMHHSSYNFLISIRVFQHILISAGLEHRETVAQYRMSMHYMQNAKCTSLDWYNCTII